MRKGYLEIAREFWSYLQSLDGWPAGLILRHWAIDEQMQSEESSRPMKDAAVLEVRPEAWLPGAVQRGSIVRELLEGCAIVAPSADLAAPALQAIEELFITQSVVSPSSALSGISTANYEAREVNTDRGTTGRITRVRATFLVTLRSR